MKFHQIRNATAVIEYAGTRFLIDPMLAPKRSFPGFPGTMNSHLANPLVALPVPLEKIIDVDAVIVTHTHPDHWDATAKELLPKDLPFLVQNEDDASEIRQAGFTDVRLLDRVGHFRDIHLIKTNGQHGSDKAMAELGDILGQVCGVIFMHPDEKSLYLAGDTVWNHHVRDIIAEYEPEIIIVNSGDAQVIGLGSIIMNKNDVLEVHNACPKASIIATHMEAVNHATLSRKELKTFLTKHGSMDRVLIPEDGEIVQVSK